MTPLETFLSWLQKTGLAQTVAQSTPITAVLSGIHLLGLTLVAGGALISGMRMLGVLLPDRPVSEVTGPASRGMGLGMTISITTGLLLFLPKAEMNAENGYFQLKMVLLFAAVAFFLFFFRPIGRRAESARLKVASTGAVSLALWFGVVLAGCAFILLE